MSPDERPTGPLQSEQLPLDDADGLDVVDAELLDDPDDMTTEQLAEWLRATVRPAPAAAAGPAELTLTQAADAVGVSRRTLHRRLAADELPGAHKGGQAGSWLIPWPALLAAGYNLTTPADDPTSSTTTPRPTSSTPTPDAHELDELRERLADAERRAAVAEAVAAERQRLILAHELNLTELRAQLVERTQAHPAQDSTPQRIRWWRRSSQ